MSLEIVATSLPKTLEEFQLALSAAFAGGQAMGKALAEPVIPQKLTKNFNEGYGAGVRDGLQMLHQVKANDDSFAQQYGITGCTDTGQHSVQLIFRTRTAANKFREANGLTKDSYL